MDLKHNNNLSIVHQYIEYLNEHETLHIECFWRKDHKLYLNNNIPMDSPDHRELIDLLLKAFPDFRINIVDEVSDQNKIVIRGTFSGMHKKSFLGFDPVNKVITLNWTGIFEITNGKILNEWLILDSWKLIQLFGMKKGKQDAGAILKLF